MSTPETKEAGVTARSYRIGTPGRAWGAEERKGWRGQTEVKRTYQEEVLDKLELLRERFEVKQYGALSYIDAERYPLFAVKTKGWAANKPTVLITGGVHGYETSGVQGALLFLHTKAEEYNDRFNILVAPCVSPWGYERVQRWNANAEDPNRGFYPNTTVEECAALMSLVASLDEDGKAHNVTMHIDLHETTDSDESEFRPAKAARDGVVFEAGSIPDGFYLVGDSANPQPEWHVAMIEAVRQVTHIAPPDSDQQIIGFPVRSEGVVAVVAADMKLCMQVTNADFATTTEVYPDSPQATDEQCNRAQVACVTGALDHLCSVLSTMSLS